MANFAVVVNGIVENIIVADDLETAEIVTGKTCVASDETLDKSAHIGLGYDATTGFEQPAIAPSQLTPPSE